jgi:hypothetical protein
MLRQFTRKFLFRWTNVKNYLHVFIILYPLCQTIQVLLQQRIAHSRREKYHEQSKCEIQPSIQLKRKAQSAN